MPHISRRFAAKLAAAAGATLLAPGSASAEPPSAPIDKELAMAQRALDGYMFSEQHTQTLDDLHLGMELVITSATRDGKKESVYLRSRSARVFRADTTLDHFTKQGGVHWRIGKTEGKTQLASPGALVLAIRDDTTTVRWYTLTYDLRC